MHRSSAGPTPARGPDRRTRRSSGRHWCRSRCPAAGPGRPDDRCEVLVFGEPAQAGGHRLGGDEAAAEERQEHQRHGQVAGRLDALGHQATPQTTMSAGTWIRRIAASCSRLSSSVVGCQRSPAPGGGTRRPLRRSPTIGARLHIAARRHGVGDVRRYNPDGHGRVRHAPTVPQRVAYRRCTARVTDIGDRSAAVAPHLIGPLVEEGSAAVVDVEGAASRPDLGAPQVRQWGRASGPARLRVRWRRESTVLLRGADGGLLEVEELGLADAELVHLFHVRL
jgi:hypothetical protein